MYRRWVSLSFPCSEKSLSIPGFPGLWPPCIAGGRCGFQVVKFFLEDAYGRQKISHTHLHLRLQDAECLCDGLHDEYVLFQECHFGIGKRIIHSKKVNMHMYVVPLHRVIRALVHFSVMNAPHRQLKGGVGTDVCVVHVHDEPAEPWFTPKCLRHRGGCQVILVKYGRLTRQTSLCVMCYVVNVRCT